MLGVLHPERQIEARTRELREQASGALTTAELDEGIDAVLTSWLMSPTIPEICALGGITVEDLTKSRTCQEIVGIGLTLGEARCLALGEAKVTVRQQTPRSGVLEPELVERIEALPLEPLDSLAEALPDLGAALIRRPGLRRLGVGAGSGGGPRAGVSGRHDACCRRLDGRHGSVGHLIVGGSALTGRSSGSQGLD